MISSWQLNEVFDTTRKNRNVRLRLFPVLSKVEDVDAPNPFSQRCFPYTDSELTSYYHSSGSPRAQVMDVWISGFSKVEGRGHRRPYPIFPTYLPLYRQRPWTSALLHVLPSIIAKFSKVEVTKVRTQVTLSPQTFVPGVTFLIPTLDQRPASCLAIHHGQVLSRG